jgi:hypothetical protein
MCDQCVRKYQNAKFKEDRYFVKEVEIQLRKNPLRGSKTQDINYSENKASNKAVILTYLYATIVPCTLTRTYT